jgi:hypothetical protein
VEGKVRCHIDGLWKNELKRNGKDFVFWIPAEYPLLQETQGRATHSFETGNQKLLLKVPANREANGLMRLPVSQPGASAVRTIQRLPVAMNPNQS